MTQGVSLGKSSRMREVMKLLEALETYRFGFSHVYTIWFSSQQVVWFWGAFNTSSDLKCEVIINISMLSPYVHIHAYYIFYIYIYIYALYLYIYIHCIFLVPPYHTACHILEHVRQNHMTFTGQYPAFFMSTMAIRDPDHLWERMGRKRWEVLEASSLSHALWKHF